MLPAVAVIFDMDGVLVDSADAHRRAWQQLGEEIGVAFTAERFRQSFGQSNASIIPAWLDDVSPARVGELGQRKEILYRALVAAGHVRVYPGVAALFTQLRQCEVRLAIASSGPRANIAMLVDVIGCGDLIDAIVAAEDVSRGKPDPETFVCAAGRLAVEPQHCAVIEDSIHGIEAARRAGMLPIAVLTTADPGALRASGAALLVPAVGSVAVEPLVSRLRVRSTSG